MRILTVLTAVGLSVALEAFGATGKSSGFVRVLKHGEPEPRAYEPVASVVDERANLVDTDRVFTALRADDFELDGEVEGKPCWKRATCVDAFARGKKGPALAPPSDVRLLYSADALYVGAVLRQPMENLTAMYDQHDLPVWEDDNLELFLHVPGESGTHLLQFAFNANGCSAELRDGLLGYTVKGLEAKARRFADRWTLEAKIPFAGIPMESPLPGDFVGARFCRRIRNPVQIFAATPPLSMGGNDRKADFARLVFASPDCLARDAQADAAADRLRAERDARQFAAKLSEMKERFRELEAAEILLSGDCGRYERARKGVAEMRAAFAAFDKSGDRKALLAEWTGFQTFVSANAYAVWRTDPWEKGSPTDRPPQGVPRTPTLEFNQAGNEREAICLDFHGLLTGSRLDLRVVPVSYREGGRFVSCDQFEVAVEPFVRLEGQTITAPLVRAPGNIVTLTPGRTVRVRITFNSRGVPAGDYRTVVALKPAYDDGIAVRELPVVAKVWNFTLPETRDWPLQTILWGPCAFRNDEVKMAQLMHDSHVTYVWTRYHQYQWGQFWDGLVSQKKTDPATGYDFDPELARTANDEFFRTARRLGLKVGIGWSTPHSPEWYRIMSDRLAKYGFSKGDYTFKGLILDEFQAKDIPSEADARKAVAAAVPGLNFQCTLISTPPPNGVTVEQIEKSGLADFITQWVVYYRRLDEDADGPELVKMLRRHGREVWSYRCDRNMMFKDLVQYYRLYAWNCYMRKYDGMAFWTMYCPADYTPKCEDSFSSAHGLNEGLGWRGLDKELISTKALEAVREGLEDVAYMDRLAKELDRVAAKGEAFPTFKTLLDGRQSVYESNDGKRVDDWRLAVGRAIDSLTKR